MEVDELKRKLPTINMSGGGRCGNFDAAENSLKVCVSKGMVVFARSLLGTLKVGSWYQVSMTSACKCHSLSPWRHLLLIKDF